MPRTDERSELLAGDHGRAPRPRRRLRIFAAVAGSLLLLLIVLVALAPAIASPIVRPMVADAAADALGGPDASGALGRLRLSWLGPQVVQDLRVVAPDGEVLTDLDVRAETGLLPLLFGRRDLGEVRLAGLVTVPASAADGPPKDRDEEPAAPSEGFRLPDALRAGRATLLVDGLSVRFAGAPTAIEGVRGRVDLAPDAASSAELEGTAGVAGGASGKFSLAASAEDLFTPNGALDLAAARFSADVSAEGVPSEITEPFLAAGRDAAPPVGEALGVLRTLRLRASGRLEEFQADLLAEFDAARADVAVRASDGSLALIRPATLAADAGRLALLSPRLAAQLREGEAARFDDLPSLALAIDALRAPAFGGPVPWMKKDWREARIAARLTIADFAGAYAAPGGEPADAASPGTDWRPFAVRGGTFELHAEPLSNGVAARGALRVTDPALADEGGSLGELALDASATDVLTSSGGIRLSAIPPVRGSLRLNDLATAIVAPFVDPLGVSLTDLVGERLDASVAAESDDGAATTRLTLAAEGPNLAAGGRLRIDRGLVTTEGAGDGAGDGPGLSLTLADLTPVAAARLGEALGERAGMLELHAARGLAVRVPRLSIDLPAALRENRDLRSLEAVAEIELAQASATARPEAEGAEPVRVTIDGLSLRAETAPLAEGLVATGRGELTTSAAPTPGSIQLRLAVDDLLGPDGDLAEGPPLLRGGLGLGGVPLAVVQPFVPRGADGAPAIDLVEALGPVATVMAEATLNAEPPHGFEPATALRLSLGAGRANVIADLRLSEQRLATGVDGMQIQGIDTGGLLGALGVLPEGMAASGAGRLQGRVRSFVLPLVDGAPALERATVNAEFTLTDLTIEQTRRRGGFAPAGGALLAPGPKQTAGLRAQVPQARLRLDRAEGGPLNAEVQAAVASGETGGTLAGALSLPDPFGADPLAGAAGELAIEGVPGAVAEIFLPAPEGEGTDLGATLADLLGRSFDARAELTTAADGARSGTLTLRGANVRADATGTLGETRLAGDGEIRIDGSAAQRLAAGASDLGWVWGEALSVVFQARLAGAAPEGAAVPYDAGTISLAVAGDRVSTPRPLRLRLAGASTLTLEEPAGFEVEVPPEVLTDLLAAEGTGGPAVRATAPLRASAELTRLALRLPASPDGGEPTPLGVLALEAGASAPAVGLEVLREGEAPVPAAYEAVRVRVAQGREQGSYTLTAEATPVAAQPGAAAAPPVRVTASAERLTDAEGALDLAGAAIDLNIQAEGVRTALVDALAGAGGQLSAVLGPTASLRVTGTDLPSVGSTLALDASSPTSRLSLRGRVEALPGEAAAAGPDAGPLAGRALRLTEPARATLGQFRVTPGDFVDPNDPSVSGLVRSVLLPLNGLIGLGEVVKEPGMQPAQLEIEHLLLPLDGGLRWAEARVTVDPGVLTYRVAVGLDRILRTGVARTREAGNSLEPFTVSLGEGVVRYERVRIPLGEFALESSAAIDLVNRTEDIAVYAPVGALAAEALDVGGIGAALLGEALRVPIVRAGPLGADNRWRVDLSAIRRNREEPDPRQILDRLGELLGGSGRGREGSGGE